MSTETEYRARLAAYAPLVALVSTRIAQNAVPQGEAVPLVVFAASHNPSRGIDGTLLADEVLLATQCWAGDGVTADAVADAVEAAVSGWADVLTRGTEYNEEMKLDCTALTVQRWVV